MRGSPGAAERPHRGPAGPHGAEASRSTVLPRIPRARSPLTPPGAAPHLVLGVPRPAGAAPGPQPRLAHAGPAPDAPPTAAARGRHGTGKTAADQWAARDGRWGRGSRGPGRAQECPDEGARHDEWGARGTAGQWGAWDGRGAGHGRAQVYPDNAGCHDAWRECAAEAGGERARGKVPGCWEKPAGFVLRDKRVCVMASFSSGRGA